MYFIETPNYSSNWFVYFSPFLSLSLVIISVSIILMNECIVFNEWSSCQNALFSGAVVSILCSKFIHLGILCLLISTNQSSYFSCWCIILNFPYQTRSRNCYNNLSFHCLSSIHNVALVAWFEVIEVLTISLKEYFEIYLSLVPKEMTFF